jgi:hypothetical protein
VGGENRLGAAPLELVVVVVLLDTNCLIDLEDAPDPRAADLARILAAARGGSFEIGVAAISASENPRRGCGRSFAEFKELLARVGLVDARVLPPMAYYDVTFWGHSLWVNDEMLRLERRIHSVLAPNLAMDDMRNRRKWLNTKCDVQVVWTHIWHKTDVLVTSDEGIARKSATLATLGANVYLPSAFVATL